MAQDPIREHPQRNTSSTIVANREEEGFQALPPSIEGLPACIEDVRQAGLDGDTGPVDPTEFNQLRGRLETARLKLPPLYRETVFTPYVQTLNELGPTGFNQVLLRDPAREGAAGLMLDIAHAILQNGEGFNERQTDTFQEVVSDLYDGFLSAEDRIGVEPPDLGIVPPLVKWGRPDFGPYTFPIEATSTFGCGAAVVSLPPGNARRGLLAWAALAHETAGHDILSADTGLRAQLIQAVFAALQANNMDFLANYWASRIDETAADTMGILNMGPAAGIGLVGYFRGLNAAFTGEARLRNQGPATDPHPADIVRGFLAASTVRLLQFQQADAWGDIIESETRNDVRTIRLAGRLVSEAEARESAQLVAETIAKTRLPALENHALLDIQNWRDLDEEITTQLRSVLTTATQLPTQFATGIFAAHAVAAAVMVALDEGSTLSLVFARMIDILKRMHDGNPSWGPLFVRHPGNLAIHRAYEEFLQVNRPGQIGPLPGRSPGVASTTTRRSGARRQRSPAASE